MIWQCPCDDHKQHQKGKCQFVNNCWSHNFSFMYHLVCKCAYEGQFMPRFHAIIQMMYLPTDNSNSTEYTGLATNLDKMTQLNTRT